MSGRNGFCNTLSISTFAIFALLIIFNMSIFVNNSFSVQEMRIHLFFGINHLLIFYRSLIHVFFLYLQQYLEQAQDLVFNENVLLQTLGFDVAIDHPHTHVVRCCHLVRGKCGYGPLFYAAEA